MQIIDIKSAAKTLGMCPRVLALKARQGKIPASKVGRSWKFIDVDLVAYIRDGYEEKWQHLVDDEKKEKKEGWPFGKEEKFGGLTSTLQTEQEYNAALGPQTN